jgi:hypothetical protein
MTDVQVWIIIGIAVVYCVAKAYVWRVSDVENKRDSDKWEAESVLTACMHMTCESLYAAYKKAAPAGVITGEQTTDLFDRARIMAADELYERGICLGMAMTPFQIGRQLRVAYDDFVKKQPMRVRGKIT